jgi:hypothetical protein
MKPDLHVKIALTLAVALVIVAVRSSPPVAAQSSTRTYRAEEIALTRPVRITCPFLERHSQKPQGVGMSLRSCRPNSLLAMLSFTGSNAGVVNIQPTQRQDYPVVDTDCVHRAG